jgi:hypothetical protein
LILLEASNELVDMMSSDITAYNFTAVFRTILAAHDGGNTLCPYVRGKPDQMMARYN